MSAIPIDYFESRARFRSMVASARGLLSTFPVPSLSDGCASLSVDTAFLGDDSAGRIVVLMSGVHGVEGYAGSACIADFLARYPNRYKQPGLAFLLVHALNPWGFANDCRVTEENVDLNRNFVDFSGMLPSSSQYARFHPILCERYTPGVRGMANELRLVFSVLGRRRRRVFQQAITAGQYAFSDGLFFGGNAPTANRDIWSRIMQTYLRSDQHVRFLDIHTGLGARGQGALITHLPESSPKFKAANDWLEDQLTSTADGSTVSAALNGMLPAYVEQQLGEQCIAITLEFGVTAALPTLNAMRTDNWLRAPSNKAASMQRHAQTKQKVRNAFLVREQVWEYAILERFRWTVERLVCSLPNMSTRNN
jgi:predicted deacylase